MNAEHERRLIRALEKLARRDISVFAEAWLIVMAILMHGCMTCH
jgi:hypothetical protein